MKRYDKVNVVRKTDKARRKYETVQYPIIPPKINDTYIIGAFGDRLDNLAWEYYKDPSLWWIIARANGIGLGNLSVPIGEQLRIPHDTEGIIEEFNNLNTISEE